MTMHDVDEEVAENVVATDFDAAPAADSALDIPPWRTWNSFAEVTVKQTRLHRFSQLAGLGSLPPVEKDGGSLDKVKGHTNPQASRQSRVSLRLRVPLEHIGWNPADHLQKILELLECLGSGQQDNHLRRAVRSAMYEGARRCASTYTGASSSSTRQPSTK